MPKGIPKKGINKGWFTSELRPHKKTGTYKICQCGTQFYCEKGRLNRKKYCSIKCRCVFHPKGAKYSQEAKDRISKAKKGVGLSESHRNKIREALIGRKQSPEHIEAMKKGIKYGKDSWRYIQDRNLLKRSEKKHLDSKYKEWMLFVKKRDGWKCRINNSDCKGRLEAHHILNWKDYPELRYELNNGITLCHAHHPRGREKEAELSPYFQSLVAEMN